VEFSSSSSVDRHSRLWEKLGHRVGP
jgi:hypothetical protein